MEDIASYSAGRPRKISTIGHSTGTLVEFIALLREARIELLVDVRSIPRSRTNPQFNIDVLQRRSPQPGSATIIYSRSAVCGISRKDAMPSANTLWRIASFRNFADYAETDAFHVGLEELKTLGRDKCCVIMAPKPCGGAATAVSSRITFWRAGSR